MMPLDDVINQLLTAVFRFKLRYRFLMKRNNHTNYRGRNSNKN
jgi:hypothetical protein